MKHPVHNIFRIARSFGVVLTLLTTLLASSAQGAYEDCSEELASQEIELVLGGREQRRSEPRDDSNGLNRPVRELNGHVKAVRNSFFVIAKERQKLNGLGTHLRL
jgi:hypothetical protein